MKFLITATEAAATALNDHSLHGFERAIIPCLEALIRLEGDRTIIAGGMPVGERGVVFIVETKSNDEVDGLLRRLPMWRHFQWSVTPLQGFNARVQIERKLLRHMTGSQPREARKRLLRRRIKAVEAQPHALSRFE